MNESCLSCKEEESFLVQFFSPSRLEKMPSMYLRWPESRCKDSSRPRWTSRLINLATVFFVTITPKISDASLTSEGFQKGNVICLRRTSKSNTPINDEKINDLAGRYKLEGLEAINLGQNQSIASLIGESATKAFSDRNCALFYITEGRLRRALAVRQYWDDDVKNERSLFEDELRLMMEEVRDTKHEDPLRVYQEREKKRLDMTTWWRKNEREQLPKAIELIEQVLTNKAANPPEAVDVKCGEGEGAQHVETSSDEAKKWMQAQETFRLHYLSGNRVEFVNGSKFRKPKTSQSQHEVSVSSPSAHMLKSKQDVRSSGQSKPLPSAKRPETTKTKSEGAAALSSTLAVTEPSLKARYHTQPSSSPIVRSATTRGRIRAAPGIRNVKVTRSASSKESRARSVPPKS